MYRECVDKNKGNLYRPPINRSSPREGPDVLQKDLSCYDCFLVPNYVRLETVNLLPVYIHKLRKIFPKACGVLLTAEKPAVRW